MVNLRAEISTLLYAVNFLVMMDGQHHWSIYKWTPVEYIHNIIYNVI